MCLTEVYEKKSEIVIFFLPTQSVSIEVFVCAKVKLYDSNFYFTRLCKKCAKFSFVTDILSIKCIQITIYSLPPQSHLIVLSVSQQTIRLMYFIRCEVYKQVVTNLLLYLSK